MTNYIDADAKRVEQIIRQQQAEIERLERHIKDLRELREFDRAKIERLKTTLGYLADNITDPTLITVVETALRANP